MLELSQQNSVMLDYILLQKKIKNISQYFISAKVQNDSVHVRMSSFICARSFKVFYKGFYTHDENERLSLPSAEIGKCFSQKGQIVSVYSFVGHSYSLRPSYSILPLPCESSCRQSMNKWVCSNKM